VSLIFHATNDRYIMIAIGSDNLVQLLGLYDNIAAAFVNDATVTGSLINPATNTNITTFTLTTTNADGNYNGTLTAAVTGALTNGNPYVIQITAVQPGGYTLVLQEQETATYKQG